MLPAVLYSRLLVVEISVLPVLRTHSTAANSRSNVPNSSNQYSVLQDIDSDSSDHDHTDPDFREA